MPASDADRQPAGAAESGARLLALGQTLDSWIARPRFGFVRMVVWAAINYVLLLLAAVAGYLLLALPPLSLLPSDQPLSLEDHALLTWVYGSFGWPVHLCVVAAVSRARRARLWVVLTTPLLSLIIFGLVYLFAVFDATGRSTVLAFTLYGSVCRLYPWRRATPSTA